MWFKITRFVFIPVFLFSLGIGFVHADTEILRPNGAGYSIQNVKSGPVSGANWDRVSESVADDSTTFVSAAANGDWTTDFYTLSDHTASGTIDSITVYARMSDALGANSSGRIYIRTDGSNYFSDTYPLTTNWADKSNTWTINPKTGLTWTWDEVDALVAGVSLFKMVSGGVPESLLPGQPILMADGSRKNIEDVVVGDRVLSFNLDSQETEIDRVVGLRAGTHDDYLIFNETLKVSLNHVVWTRNGYKPAEEIILGDFLLNSAGQEVAVTQIDYVQELVDTYNLTIEKNHNFFSSGYLVHNWSTASCTQVYVVVTYTAPTPVVEVVPTPTPNQTTISGSRPSRRVNPVSVPPSALTTTQRSLLIAQIETQLELLITELEAMLAERGS